MKYSALINNYNNTTYKKYYAITTIVFGRIVVSVNLSNYNALDSNRSEVKTLKGSLKKCCVLITNKMKEIRINTTTNK